MGTWQPSKHPHGVRGISQLCLCLSSSSSFQLRSSFFESSRKKVRRCQLVTWSKSPSVTFVMISFMTWSLLYRSRSFWSLTEVDSLICTSSSAWEWSMASEFLMSMSLCRRSGSFKRGGSKMSLIMIQYLLRISYSTRIWYLNRLLSSSSSKL